MTTTTTNINKTKETDVPKNISNRCRNLPDNNMQTLSEESKTNISIIVGGPFHNNNNIEKLQQAKDILAITNNDIMHKLKQITA